MTLPLNETPSWPGMTHVDPNDWEFFVLGQIEGDATQAPQAAVEDLEMLHEMGLNRLRGPGAWARHQQASARSKAVALLPAVSFTGFSHSAGVQDETAR